MGTCNDCGSTKKVEFRLSDLFLCTKCDDKRHAVLKDNLKGDHATSKNSTSDKTSIDEAVGLVVQLPPRSTTTSNKPMTRSGTEQNGLVIDELLCFIVNKMQLMPTESIVRLCTTSFSEGQIEASKKKLFDLCAEESTIRFTRRIGQKKSALNIEDMVKLLIEKGTNIPTFVALDLGKLPPITFDSIDVSVLLHAIKKTQNEVDALNEGLQAHSEITNGLVDSIGIVDKRIKEIEKNDRVLVSGPTTGNSQSATIQKQNHASAGSQDKTPTGPPVPVMNYAAVVTMNATHDTDEPWAVASNQRRKKNTYEQTKNSTGNNKVKDGNAKPKGITGLMKDTGLRTVEKTLRKRVANVFATRFDPGVTENMLADYLKTKLSLDVSVDKVQTRHDSYASFHVRCVCPNPAVFMDADIWPENTFVRWWKEQKPPKHPLADLQKEPQMGEEPNLDD